jgi:hypothetical protein
LNKEDAEDTEKFLRAPDAARVFRPEFSSASSVPSLLIRFSVTLNKEGAEAIKGFLRALGVLLSNHSPSKFNAQAI